MFYPHLSLLSLWVYLRMLVVGGLFIAAIRVVRTGRIFPVLLEMERVNFMNLTVYKLPCHLTYILNNVTLDTHSHL